MILSKNSLLAAFKKMHVDLTKVPLENEAWINAFSSLGIEVEEIISNYLNENDFSVVKVISVIEHTKSNHLHIAKVDDGTCIHQVVCGASNVKEGMYTIMAKVNTKMPNGMVILSKPLLGVESSGMLCSISELFPQIAPYLHDVDKQGIVDLSLQGNDKVEFELKPGSKNWIQYLMLEDDIFDISISTNSGYLNGLIPIALVLLAYWNLKYQFEPKLIINESLNPNEFNIDNGFIYFNDKNDYANYKFRMVLAHNHLKANDLSNMKALLYSHYLAYPFLTITKNLKIDNTKIELLNNDVDIYDNKNNKYQLLKNTFVLKQKDELVASLGVLTNQSFLPKLNDEGFYLFFANNNWFEVTEMLRKNALDSYVAKLSCKEVSFYFTNKYMKAFWPYMKDCKFYINSYKQEQIRFIKCSKKDLFDKLTTYEKINETKIMHQLELIDIVYDSVKAGFNVPGYRIDLENDHDLIEEALRFINVNELKSEPIISSLVTNQDTYEYDQLNKIRNYLISLGLYETKTYKLTSLNNLQKNLFDEYNHNAIKILNAISNEREVLKHTLFNSLYNVIQYNLNQKNYLLKNIFEISNLYFDNNEQTSVILGSLFSSDIAISEKYQNHENLNLNLIFDLIKNIIHILSNNELDILFIEKKETDSFSKVFNVIYENIFVGYIGVIKQQFKNHIHDNLNYSYYLELNLSKLISLTKDLNFKKYHILSKIPSISRDLNIVLNKEFDYWTKFNELKHLLKHQISGFSELCIKDVFVQDDKKTLTLNYIIDPISNLTKEEINELNNNIKTVIDKIFN